ncbi:MAG: hypothetical protein WKF84_21900 [Pyrinomonadaceae bacterium]
MSTSSRLGKLPGSPGVAGGVVGAGVQPPGGGVGTGAVAVFIAKARPPRWPRRWCAHGCRAAAQLARHL